jgi:hypothetical protein
MFQNLLSPLKARFEGLTPRSPSATFLSPADDVPESAPDPEEFARDVLVQLMRNTVEALKTADGQDAQTEVGLLLVGSFQDIDAYLAAPGRD